MCAAESDEYDATDCVGVRGAQLKPEYRERFAVRDPDGTKLSTDEDAGQVGLCAKHRRECLVTPSEEEKRT